jgi:thiamine biosynthesis lipoprotein
MRLLVIFLFLPCLLSAQLKRFHFSQPKMGSPFNLIFYHSDSMQAIQLADECFSIVDSLNEIFSDYDPASEIRRLQTTAIIQPQKVSEELYNMIVTSWYVYNKTGGTFDITLGALTKFWRKARKENRFPSENEVKKLKQLTGFDKLKIDTVNRTIFFTIQGLELDFGGIVQGYAVQKVVNHLRNKNVHHALADASGDIAISEPPPDKTGWTIGINIPQQENELWDQKLELKNCAVATSGDMYQFILHEGKRYSHIIDPRTGYGVTSQRNVTVIAKDGTTVDWLATACSILPIEKALALIRKENAALLIATLKDLPAGSQGNKINIYKTENFDSYFQKKEL